MAQKITISADEPIVCPKDHYKFPLHQGITRQTMEKYEQEFDEEQEKQKKELRVKLEKDIKKQVAREFAGKQAELEDKLEENEKLLKRAQKAQKEAQDKARAEFEPEKEAMQKELREKDSAINAFRKQELVLRQEKKALQEEKENWEIASQRKLDAERQEIQEKAAKTEAEKLRWKFAELENKLSTALNANKELTRKLEQGSQQTQGEVLELELETMLRSAFPHDKIEPVRKGVLGADILQRVHTPTGQLCGTIIWEAKRAKAWSDKWLQKLKDDQQEAHAEIAILVTTVFPTDCKDPFMLQGDVWVARDLAARAIAESLRLMLIENSKLKVANTGRNEKMALLYDYLCSPQFAQRIRSVVETFVSMKRTLEQERTAMARLWKQRETQIERVLSNTTGMCGELQAISQDSLRQLDQIECLSLPNAGSDES